MLPEQMRALALSNASVPRLANTLGGGSSPPIIVQEIVDGNTRHVSFSSCIEVFLVFFEANSVHHCARSRVCFPVGFPHMLASLRMWFLFNLCDSFCFGDWLQFHFIAFDLTWRVDYRAIPSQRTS